MKKFTLLFVLMMMSAVAFTAVASDSRRGDVNRDGNVNIADVTCLISYVLRHNAQDTVSSAADCNQMGYVLPQKTSDFDLAAADCNLDGSIDIADVTAAISYALSHRWPAPVVAYVDLALPSGTLWATANIVSNEVFFAWGEVTAKSYYDWGNYEWCNGSQTELTKYCTKSSSGIVDDKTELEPMDDAAYMRWGPAWRMPTIEQLQELVDHCSWEWMSTGYLITGSNGHSMFLPASGYIWGGTHDGSGTCGCYWSRSLSVSFPEFAHYLYFGSGAGSISCQGSSYRAIGFSVRAVRTTQD